MDTFENYTTHETYSQAKELLLPTITAQVFGFRFDPSIFICVLSVVLQEEQVVQHQAGEKEAADALREAMKKVVICKPLFVGELIANWPCLNRGKLTHQSSLPAALDWLPHSLQETDHHSWFHWLRFGQRDK